MLYFKTMFHKAQLIYISEGFFSLTFICWHLSLFIPSEITQWASIIVPCKHLRLLIYSLTPLRRKKSLMYNALLCLTSGGWMLYVLPVSFCIILVVNMLEVYLYISFLGSASLAFLQLKNLTQASAKSCSDKRSTTHVEKTNICAVRLS